MKQDFVEVDIPRTKKLVAKRSRLAAIVSLHQVKINVYQEADPALVSEIILTACESQSSSSKQSS
ncbi:MAG: hypothetical protein SOY79_06340 [Limosilactobacillus reuteri]|nr:hypothetical protein [Limosilactobacillus reuteri]